jgi:hypothetical protein
LLELIAGQVEHIALYGKVGGLVGHQHLQGTQCECQPECICATPPTRDPQKEVRCVHECHNPIDVAWRFRAASGWVCLAVRPPNNSDASRAGDFGAFSELVRRSNIKSRLPRWEHLRPTKGWIPKFVLVPKVIVFRGRIVSGYAFRPDESMSIDVCLCLPPKVGSSSDEVLRGIYDSLGGHLKGLGVRGFAKVILSALEDPTEPPSQFDTMQSQWRESLKARSCQVVLVSQPGDCVRFNSSSHFDSAASAWLHAEWTALHVDTDASRTTASGHGLEPDQSSDDEEPSAGEATGQAPMDLGMGFSLPDSANPQWNSSAEVIFVAIAVANELSKRQATMQVPVIMEPESISGPAMIAIVERLKDINNWQRNWSDAGREGVLDRSSKGRPVRLHCPLQLQNGPLLEDGTIPLRRHC